MTAEKIKNKAIRNEIENRLIFIITQIATCIHKSDNPYQKRNLIFSTATNANSSRASAADNKNVMNVGCSIKKLAIS